MLLNCLSQYLLKLYLIRVWKQILKIIIYGSWFFFSFLWVQCVLWMVWGAVEWRIFFFFWDPAKYWRLHLRLYLWIIPHLLVNEIGWMGLGSKDTWLWVRISIPALFSSVTLGLVVKLKSHIAVIWEGN